MGGTPSVRQEPPAPGARPTQGVVRRHGQTGAFVSRFVIDRTSGRVKAGSDFINPGVKYWKYPASAYSAAPVAPAGATGGHTPEFNRFCSGSLTRPGQLRAKGVGYDGQIYFANEEAGDEGRAFGVTLDGQAYQLPRLGLLSWENTLAAYNRSATTLVMGNEDGGSGQLRAYVGTKQKSGSPVDRAGLANGALNVISVPGSPDATSSAGYGKGVSRRSELRGIDWNQSGVKQNVDAAAVGTALNRVEDGGFDPNNPNDYYFITTEGGSTAPDPTEPTNSVRDGGGVWRLSYSDIERPELGGTLTLLLDGTEAPYLNKPDNMTIDHKGNLLPGGPGRQLARRAHRVLPDRRRRARGARPVRQGSVHGRRARLHHRGRGVQRDHRAGQGPVPLRRPGARTQR